jgi:hypothetical protein
LPRIVLNFRLIVSDFQHLMMAVATIALPQKVDFGLASQKRLAEIRSYDEKEKRREAHGDGTMYRNGSLHPLHAGS